MKTISFVIPCYASEGSVALVMEEIRQTVAEKPFRRFSVRTSALEVVLLASI